MWIIKLSERESACCRAPLSHHHTKSPYNTCTKCKQKCDERMIGAPDPVTDPFKRGYEAGYEAALKHLLEKSIRK